MATLSAHYDSAYDTQQTLAGRGFRARAVRAVLFATIFSSPFVLTEPSIYEAAVLILALTAIACGLAVDRKLLPLIVLLLLWSASGAAALTQVLQHSDALIYFLVSLYLQITAVLFACLVATDTMSRLGAVRTAYIWAAVLASLLGILGYFQVLPFSEILLENGRARATFKDPNVFGPFLILPLLLLVQQVLHLGARPRYIVAFVIILIGLFLSFSRGAWAHFVGSATLMLWLMFIAAPSLRARARIVTFALLASFAVLSLLAVLLSLDAVSSMFTERASLAQSYDVGESGRFGKQWASLDVILTHPNGLGPEQFGRQFGQAPHNVYINAFVAYGWVGGIALVTLTALTLVYGFQALFIRSPWQTYLIALYSTYVGLMAESFVIDTDHWRHMFLVLGLVWGLVAATSKFKNRESSDVISVR